MAVLVKSLNGLAYASVKSRNGLAVASIKNINGLDTTAGGFIPPDIAGCMLWLPADYITGLSNNDPVSTWEDESGNNYDATSSGSTRPLYKTNQQNGLPTLEFDGSDDFIGGSRGVLTSYTVFMVLKQNSAGGFSTAYRLDGGASDALWIGNLFPRNGNGGGSVDTGDAFSTYKLLVWVVAGASTAEAFVNGVSVGTTGSSSIPIDTSYRIAAQFDGGGAAAQFVGEFGLFNSALGGTDLSDLTTYAMDKWAL